MFFIGIFLLAFTVSMVDADKAKDTLGIENGSEKSATGAQTIKITNDMKGWIGTHFDSNVKGEYLSVSEIEVQKGGYFLKILSGNGKVLRKRAMRSAADAKKILIEINKGDLLINYIDRISNKHRGGINNPKRIAETGMTTLKPKVISRTHNRVSSTRDSSNLSVGNQNNEPSKIAGQTITTATKGHPGASQRQDHQRKKLRANDTSGKNKDSSLGKARTKTAISGASFSKKNAIILYEDDLVVIYDDNPRHNYVRQLTAIHKVGSDDEIFSVNLKEFVDSHGNKQTGYCYGSSVFRNFKYQLAPLLEKNPPERVTILHFVEGKELPLVGLGGKPQNASAEGRPVATIIFTNTNYETDIKNIRSWAAQPPPVWEVLESPCPYDHTIVGRYYTNTYSKAAAWTKDGPVKMANRARAVAASEISKKYQFLSTAASIYGYKNYHPLFKHDNVEYFLIESKYINYINIIAVHDNKTDDEFLVDLDILLTVDSSNRVQLSYMMPPYEIQEFNDVLAPVLENLEIRRREIRVWHHLKGKTFPVDLRKYVSLGGTDIDRPVFVSNFEFDVVSNSWQPTYKHITDMNPFGIGQFGSYSSRYSYNSTLAYLQKEKKKQETRYRVNPKPSIKDVNEAYAHASPQLLKRRDLYSLWTWGYWVFYDFPIGRNIIDGKFGEITFNKTFRSFFIAYIKTYSDKCSATIKNPRSFKDTHLYKDVDSAGFTINEDKHEFLITMDEKFVEKFEEYYINYSGQDHLSGVMSILKGGANSGPKGVRNAIGREMYIVNKADNFVTVEPCNSPTMKRFSENLLRFANQDDPIKNPVAFPE